jgi:hypothetical protein
MVMGHCRFTGIGRMDRCHAEQDGDDETKTFDPQSIDEFHGFSYGHEKAHPALYRMGHV